jgi:hypothetical protein
MRVRGGSEQSFDQVRGCEHNRHTVSLVRCRPIRPLVVIPTQDTCTAMPPAKDPARRNN